MSIKTKKIKKQQRNSEQPENHNTISSTLQNIKSYKRNKEKKQHNYKKITILSKYYIFICILYSYHVPLSMHTESKFKHTKK